MEEEDTPSSSDQQNHWIKIQDELKTKLITGNSFSWEIPPSSSPSSSSSFVNLEEKKEVQVPYIPGFLAFREAPILLKLLEKMKNDAHPFYPQLLMVDGNGLLHPRGFGLACHLGVMADIPTIGIGKNLHHVEGLNHSEVRNLLEADDCKQSVYLNGNSGRTLGAAIRSTTGALKPIFISVGHRISLTSAMKIVKMTCKYRVPEPIRQADLRSREYLRKHPFVS